MTELIYLLLMTHITIVCVTLYLHRGQTHKGITFHPIAAHFMRFWLWLTTGMVTKQWVAIHRKHHQMCEKPGDPHSPHVYGIWHVLFKGALLYHEASKDKDMVNTYGVGTPADWMEHNIYTAYSRLGIGILLVLNLILFGWIGLLLWGIQMIWIPFWAAGVINGLGHWWGYRNTDTKDRSKNISILGIIIGGEEFHNNHHAEPANPKLSRKWWEFDIGWMWFKILEKLKLAGVKRMKKFDEIRPRKYPDGTLIPKTLPPAYAVGNSKENCANCGAYVPGTKYCKTWDAKVKPNYWCKKWIPIKKQTT